MKQFLLALICVASALTAPAVAQTPCPDGRTASGACVKSDLAEDVRRNVLALTQSKLSYTAPPFLPSEDGVTAVPRDAGELRRIYGIDRALVCTTTGGGAAPLTTTCQ